MAGKMVPKYANQCGVQGEKNPGIDISMTGEEITYSSVGKYVPQGYPDKFL